MKKLIFLLSFFFAVGICAATAQSCPGGHDGKSCSAKISKAAAADPTIEQRKADDGTMSYVRKETDAQGNVAFVNVQYDEATQKFVTASAKTISSSDKASCTKKKACCAGAKDGKACCAKPTGEVNQ